MPDSSNLDAALDRVLPDVNLAAVPFEDVIWFLRDITGVNYHVNWIALEAAGIDRNTAVTLRLKEVKLRRILELILKDLGHGVPHLNFEAAENVIYISILPSQTAIESPNQASSSTGDLKPLPTPLECSTQVYDIRDLITRLTEFDAAAPLAGHDASVLRVEQTTALIRWIEDTVATDTWIDNGGDIGLIRVIGGQLIITQTVESQSELASLLSSLRVNVGSDLTQSGPTADTTRAAPIHVPVDPRINLLPLTDLQKTTFSRAAMLVMARPARHITAADWLWEHYGPEATRLGKQERGDTHEAKDPVLRAHRDEIDRWHGMQHAVSDFSAGFFPPGEGAEEHARRVLVVAVASTFPLRCETLGHYGEWSWEGPEQSCLVEGAHVGRMSILFDRDDNEPLRINEFARHGLLQRFEVLTAKACALIEHAAPVTPPAQQPQSFSPPATATPGEQLSAHSYPSGDFTTDLVSLDQAASIVHRKKRALEAYKSKGLPDPDIKGGGGKPNLWKWQTIRPFLLRFRPDLPERFPGNIG